MNDTQQNVWIDREEYLRLKSLENQTATAATVATGSGPAASGAGSVDSTKSKVSPLTILTGISAFLSFIYPPVLIIFLGLGCIGIVKFFTGKASSMKKTIVGSTLAISLLLGAVTLGPFLLLFPMLIFWQLGCWTGLGSCTSV